MSPKPETALLILGHGSTENADSSVPTWGYTDRITELGLFRRVYCAFWKEEPSFRQITAMIEEKEVYVVPAFISEGYFTREIIPRELELEGRTTVRMGKTFYYTDPVGSHPSMTSQLIRQAVAAQASLPFHDETALIIVGHGTKRNSNSSRAVLNQVDNIKAATDSFSEVIGAFMDEPPFIEKWSELTDAPTVIVVPFFIAEGLHSHEDIPRMIGMNPIEDKTLSYHRQTFGEQTLIYTQSIGSDPGIADVLLDQVDDFDRHHRS